AVAGAELENTLRSASYRQRAQKVADFDADGQQEFVAPVAELARRQIAGQRPLRLVTRAILGENLRRSGVAEIHAVPLHRATGESERPPVCGCQAIHGPVIATVLAGR